jgi:hypothetical protein
MMDKIVSVKISWYLRTFIDSDDCVVAGENITEKLKAINITNDRMAHTKNSLSSSFLNETVNCKINANKDIDANAICKIKTDPTEI